MDGSDNPNGGWLTRATPENQQETATRDPQRPYANHLVANERDEEMVHALRRRRDMSMLEENGRERNSLSGRRNLPLQRVIAEANPANNGEALAHLERVIPWEVWRSIQMS